MVESKTRGRKEIDTVAGSIASAEQVDARKKEQRS